MNFRVVDENPNNVYTGSCLCHGSATSDCKAPFVVFDEHTLDGPDPVAVICSNCITHAGKAIKDGEEKQKAFTKANKASK